MSNAFRYRCRCIGLLVLLVATGEVAVCRADHAVLPDLALQAWRLQATNVVTSVERGFRGRGPVFRLKYPANPSVSGGAVELATFPLKKMLDSWIPPSVGMNAKTVSFDILPVECSGGVVPQFCFKVRGLGNGASGIEVCDHVKKDWWKGLVQGEWNTLAFDAEVAANARLGDMRFLFVGKAQARCEFLLANVRIVLKNGSVYEVLHPNAPRYGTLMDKPLADKPVKPFPRRSRIQFGISSYWCERYRRELPVIGDFMAKYLPEYDIVFSLGSDPDPLLPQAMAMAPDNIYFQFQKGQHDLRYAAVNDALVKDRFGRRQPKLFNSSVATHPILRNAYEEQMAYIGALGFNNVQQYDYVWYYPDGPWGFDPASVDAFREDLAGRDEGLVLAAASNEPERTIRFWDYYEEYHGAGTRLSASGLGLSDWNEYLPRFTSDAERSLHWALVAYEWLRLAQRFGRWSRKYCYGSPYDYLLNGESCANGNDHVFLMRLKDTGIISPEFFDFTPKFIGGVYRGSGRFLREAKRYGKKCGITVEESRGGGPSQPYWSPKTGYVICYTLSAIGYEGFEYDHLSGRDWNSVLDRSRPGLWKNLAIGMADARGYRQAKVDCARKPCSGKVLYVTDRPPCRTGLANLFSGATYVKGEYRSELESLGLDYEVTDPLELPAMLERAGTVFVSPVVKRWDTRELLDRWQKAAQGRTLATNVAEAVSVARRFVLPVLQRTAGDALALPFTCGEGHNVAALFNKKRAMEADHDKWYEHAWRPVLYKGTYDYGKLLYFDTYPGDNISAEVAVRKDGPYRVYSTIGDCEELVEAKDGWLKLSLGDRFADIFYYSEDTVEFRSFLEKVRAERNITAEFFKD